MEEAVLFQGGKGAFMEGKGACTEVRVLFVEVRRRCMDETGSTPPAAKRCGLL